MFNNKNCKIKNKNKNNKNKNKTYINQYQLIKKYVESITKAASDTLIENNSEPKVIDLVFSSGGFNVPIGIGIGMYLKKMEKYKHIKVKRISGSSIGAFLSLWYIMHDLDDNFSFIESEFINVINHFKKNKNLLLYKSFIRKYVYKIFKTDDMTPIQKRLYITYHDTKKYKKKTVCKYKNREHLINTIICSSNIPNITDGNATYKNRYIDGVKPYIFPNKKNRDTLFINMMYLTQVFGCISIDTKNIYKRLLIGINDANEFFINGNSSLCTYVKDITYKNQIEFFIIEIIFFIILFIMDIISIIHFNTNMIFSESIIYNTFYNFFYNFFEGFIDGFLFS